jgi:hypothetical protein
MSRSGTDLINLGFLPVSYFVGPRWSCEHDSPLFNRRILSILGVWWQALSSIRVLHRKNGICLFLQIILH